MAFSAHFKSLLSLDTAEFSTGLEKASKKVGKFSGDIKKFTGLFAKFLGATALVAFGKSVLDSAGKVADLSTRLGVSTSFLQKFNYAMENAGVDAEQAGIGLQRFIRRISNARENGGELKKTLDQMNISLNNSNGTAKDSEQLFIEFADGLGRITDPSKKVATAFQFLDTSGVAMLQSISEGSSEFRKFGKEAEDLGFVISDNAIDTMAKLDDEILKNTTRIKVLGAKVLPVLIKGLSILITSGQGAIEMFKMFGTGFELFGKTAKKYIGDTFEKLGAKVDLFVAQVNYAVNRLDPFSNDKTLKTAEDKLLKMERKYAEVAKRTSASFMGTRNQILKADENLAKRREGHEIRRKQLRREILNTFYDTNNIQKKNNEISEQEVAIIERAFTARDKINSRLEQQLERIQALKRGGQEELDLVVERQKAEAQIVQLMNEGQMTREQAEQKITNLINLQNEEKTILEELKIQEKEREEAKKRLSENNKLVLQLQEEKKLNEEVKLIEDEIYKARLDNRLIDAEALEQKKINLLVANEELANRDKVRAKLQGEILDIQAKRAESNLELQVLNLIAQGRTLEAEKLQASLDAQKEIKRIQMELRLGEKEAINQLNQQVMLERQIALNKLNQRAQEIQNNEVKRLAQKDIRDAEDADERARIRRAKKVQALERRIVELRENGSDTALKMAEDLEKKKAGHLEVVFDEKTKKELAVIDDEKLKIKKDFDLQLEALDKRFKEINKAEQEAQIAEKKRLQEVQKKQLELIKKARESEEVLKTKLIEAGDKAKQKIQDGFDAVINKLQFFKNPKIDLKTPEIDLSGIASVFSEIPSALSRLNIPSIPEMPEPDPTLVKVEVDTESLLTENTGKNIETALKGKFVNQ